MRGLMMETPLLIPSLLDHAASYHGDTEVVSRLDDGTIHRATYAETQIRAKRLASALLRLGVGLGDRVGTLAWNSHRHLELYYAISGIGAVCHTLNPRLFPEQLAYIVAHAEDRYLAVDPGLVPLVEPLLESSPALEGTIVLADEHEASQRSVPSALGYEALLAAEDNGFDWPALDEHTASSLCYTSGTTGHPKGVLYSHRTTVLHAMGSCLPDALDLSSQDVVLPVVPMFHANAWGIPYAAPLCGAQLVFPGPRLDGASLLELIDLEGVTVLAGVPTVWLMLLDHLRGLGRRLEGVERVVIGGSAAPKAMIEAFEEEHDVRVLHAWGMTETSPLGTVSRPKGRHRELSREARTELQAKQGRPVFGVEVRVVDDDGRELPRDGESCGELMVRGLWTVGAYFKGEGGEILDAEGWFRTGDVATLDADGFVQITDRSKDVIKSGGEWISSIDLENEALGHPGVAEAAVIGVPHPKWGERPVLIVVPSQEGPPSRQQLLEHLETRVVRWWLPDDVVFLDELPHTATGKVSKRTLRERYRDHPLPTVESVESERREGR